MRNLLLIAAAAAAGFSHTASAHDGEAIARERRIAFPKTPDGRSVLAVDLHTHGVFTVKAGSTFTLLVKNVPDPSQLRLTFKLLNTYIAPREHLQITLADSVAN